MQIVSTLERICELQLLTTPLWSWQELTLNTQVRNSNAAIFTNGKLCNFILGNYTCEVEWSPEKAPLSLSHYLEVCVPPSVVAVKTEGGGFVDVKEGDNATLECEADGIPRPLIHWVRKQLYRRSHGNVHLCDNSTMFENANHFPNFLTRKLQNDSNHKNYLIIYGYSHF